MESRWFVPVGYFSVKREIHGPEDNRTMAPGPWWSGFGCGAAPAERGWPKADRKRHQYCACAARAAVSSREICIRLYKALARDGIQPPRVAAHVLARLADLPSSPVLPPVTYVTVPWHVRNAKQAKGHANHNSLPFVRLSRRNVRQQRRSPSKYPPTQETILEPL